MNFGKLGTWVKVPDGRIGTVVYNGLDGVGIMWGKKTFSAEEKELILSACPLFSSGKPDDWNEKFSPQAMLRDKKLEKLIGIECVGEERECEVVW